MSLYYKCTRLFLNSLKWSPNLPRRFCSSKIDTGKASTMKEPLELLQVLPSEAAGQPICYTHPHMVDTGFLTPGITQKEYCQRRDTFMSRLLAEAPNDRNHIVVIPGACKKYMSDKIPYVFRQSSDFYYLTGCLEPGAVLILIKSSEFHDKYKSVLFVHDRDPQAELWEGPRTGCDLAARLFQVDESRPIDTIKQFLNSFVMKSQNIKLWYLCETPVITALNDTLKELISKQYFNGHNDPRTILHKMRIIKSKSEIELMKHTCQIGAESMNMAIACTKPGVTEHTLNAVLEYTTKTCGAECLGFPPVIAGGERATSIHYIANNQLLKDGELVLIDTGSQFWLYNSDISRTWPVSGKFTQPQLVLYELLLTVQKRLIDILNEHRPPLNQLFDHMCRLLGKYLQEEGILDKNISGNELIAQAYDLCPHHVSHYLGLDIHDTSLISRSVPIEPGMVVTVEPGLYIKSSNNNIPAEFRGVGLRIEDDVLIQTDNIAVLTSSTPKEVEQIYKLVGKHAQ